MSWLTFIIASLLLTVFLIFLVSIPWWRRGRHTENDKSVNTRIIKQRLAEIESEVEQGLIAKSDQQQAIDELKIALVDETNSQQRVASSIWVSLCAGAGIALLVGGSVYFSANQLSQVKMASDAINALPALSDKLADGSASDFTPQDVTALTLAIRQRLQSEPDDVQGWMYLGRLWMAAGQQKQAIDALEKANQLAPENVMVSATYAQILTATGETVSLRKAQQVLSQLLVQFPNNDNFALLMSVASAQLGDANKARHFFEKVRDKLSPQSDIFKELSSRIESLEQSPSTKKEVSGTAETGFTLTINVAEELKEKIPEKGQLIVFAQDADSDNRMPAAVIKMPLQSFPRQLSLTNDNAMMANYTLSQLKNVRLVARISVDENVMPAAGELEGQKITEVIVGAMVNHSITIDKELQ